MKAQTTQHILKVMLFPGSTGRDVLSGHVMARFHRQPEERLKEGLSRSGWPVGLSVGDHFDYVKVGRPNLKVIDTIPWVCALDCI